MYLEAPSSGGKLKGQGFAQGWFYGHVLVTVKGSNVDMMVKEIGRAFRPRPQIGSTAGLRSMAAPAP